MIKKTLYVFLIVVLFATAQLTAIEADSTFKELMKNNDAVVLSDDQTFIINEIDEAVYFQKVKILIKNKEAEKYAILAFPESEFKEVSDIEAVLYDTSGNEIRELDSDDIQQLPARPGFVLYSDVTAKYTELTHNQFPYIIEYSFRYDYQSLFFWPNWNPQWEIPVISATYRLKIPSHINYSTFSIGNIPEPSLEMKEGEKYLTWKVKEVGPVQEEDFMPPEARVQLALLFASHDFRLGDYQGSFTSWEEVSKWYWRMSFDKYYLPKDIIREIKGAVEGISDHREKIRILYRLLQDKTHYVAILPGISGWQPHTAESAWKNCYGDCKDLSNLMIAMLYEVGIDAYPAIALTRDKGIPRPKFPSNSFNHVITCVPFKNDTMWLECTADHIEAGEMPYTIEDTYVLLVKENGGKLVFTPQAPADNNVWSSCTEGKLEANGTFTFESKSTVSGLQRRYFKSLLESANKKEEKLQLEKVFSSYVSNLEIFSHSFGESEVSTRHIGLNFSGCYKKAFASMGKRVFFNPNLFNRKIKSNLPDENERQFPIHYNYPYSDIDTVIAVLPDNYILEAAPEQRIFDEPFARYSTTYHFENGKFQYIRNFTYKKNWIEPEDYNLFKTFLAKVIDSDKKKFVFKKTK